MLQKYIFDSTHILKNLPMQIEENLTYKEKPVEILDIKDQVLKTKTISLGKVLWRNQLYEKATWEKEEDMRAQYPHLFNPVGK